MRILPLGRRWSQLNPIHTQNISLQADYISLPRKRPSEVNSSPENFTVSPGILIHWM
jgi:hypothetical protein